MANSSYKLQNKTKKKKTFSNVTDQWWKFSFEIDQQIIKNIKAVMQELKKKKKKNQSELYLKLEFTIVLYIQQAS